MKKSVTQLYEIGYTFWVRREGTIHSDFLCRPQMLELAGNLDGRVVADLGCGDGYVLRLLLKSARPKNILAVDSNGDMLRCAQASLTKESNISYLKLDVRNLDGIPRRKVDVSFSCLVYPHLSFEGMVQANREAFRILKKKGKLIIALPNPLSYLVDPKSKWIRKTLIADVRAEKTVVTLFSSDGKTFGPFEQYVHPVHKILNAIQESGLRVVKMLEPLATKADMRHAPHMWGLEANIPQYLVVSAVKP